MNDSSRGDAQPTAGQADRESRTEALLVEGLDQYLAGQYEDAIHVWTRVLFLDRNHQRARAYIERARTTLVERQRRADEMLHRAEALVASGALDEAREILGDVSLTSADDSRLARVWSDLERSARARPPRAPSASPEEAPSVAAGSPRQTAASWSAAGRLVAAGSVGALLVTLLASPVVRGWFGFGDPVPATTAVPRATVAAPTAAETALIRARTLYAKGRLAEALAVLERLTPSATDRAEVDGLRVEIQSLLLAAVRAPSGGGVR